MTIELVETEEQVQLRTGDIASFPQGTRSIWTFPEPFEKFTVVSELSLPAGCPQW